MKPKTLAITSLLLFAAAELPAMIHTTAADIALLPPPREPDFSDWRVILAIILAVMYGQLGLHFFVLGYKDRGYRRLFSTIGAYAMMSAAYILSLYGKQPEIAIVMFFAGLAWLIGIYIASLVEAVMIATGQIQPLDKVLEERQAD